MTKPAGGAFSLRLVLEQTGLGLLVFLLCMLWLRVPDASALDVIGSVCLALMVVWVAGAGESAIVLRLVERERTPGRLVHGTLLLLLGVALWFAWDALLDHVRGIYSDSLVAGYWNSRFPHQLRNVFSYNHIMRWLEWLWAALEWIGTGVIAAFVFAGIASATPMRAVVRALRSVGYWCVVVLLAVGVTGATGALLNWTPGHGLRVEMLSLALRLIAVVLLDGVVVSLLLAMLAWCVRRVDALHATPAGTPDESQPRTAENP